MTARHRVNVHGDPITRTPLFPIVRITIIGALMFAGVFTAAGRIADDPAPVVVPDVVANVSSVCGVAR